MDMATKDELVKELNINLFSALKSFMKFRISKNDENKFEINDFLRLIKEKSSEHNLNQLYKLVNDYQEHLMSMESYGYVSHQEFSKFLKGMALINEEIEKLENNNLHHLDFDLLTEHFNRNTDSQKGSVVIVDSDINVVSLLTEKFKEEGYNIISASDIDHIWDEVNLESIDLFIIDVSDQAAGDIKMLRRIRNENSNLPVVFITSKDDLDYKVKSIKSGVDEYILKPFEIKEFMARVESIINRFKRYRKKVNRDNLTGVYNKKYFNEISPKLIHHLEKGKHFFSIAFIDVDYFKDINDKHGHLVGDHVLKAFVRELKKVLRENDEIFRFGGDEFLILFKDTPAKKAFDALERARIDITNREFMCKLVDVPVKLSFSAGIACSSYSDKHIEDILERADKALYDSKKQGRGKITYEELECWEEKKILIIDDSNMIVQTIKNMLLTLNHQVKFANDGKAGIDLVNSFNPDLIILDTDLPKIDGFEVCKKIRKNLRTNDSKIIVLSSNCDDYSIMHAYEVGADYYMIKPFSLNELEEKVKILLKDK